MEPPSYEEALSHSAYVEGARSLPGGDAFSQNSSFPPQSTENGLPNPPYPLPTAAAQGGEAAPPYPSQPGSSPSSDPEVAGFEVVNFSTATGGVTVGSAGFSPFAYPSVEPSAPPPPQGQPGYYPNPAAFQAPTSYLPAFNKVYHANIITEDQILASFEEYAKKKSWFFNRPKNPRRFVNIKSHNTDFRLRYKLSSYIENRSLVTRTEKVHGQHRPHQLANAQPNSDLWYYDLRPDKEWWKGSRDRVIQHTVDKCDRCFGLMKRKCDSCDTRGKVKCFPHKTIGGPCEKCGGSEMVVCSHCNGYGSVKCEKCDGIGAIRVIHSVVAKFETKDAFHFEGDSVSVPDSKLEKVNGGVPMFSDENYPPIAPLPAYPESPALNEAAMRFLREHYEKFVMRSRESTRILKQKHSLLAIPVTTVDLVYKGKQYKLWVYGTERSIHCPAMESCSIL